MLETLKSFARSHTIHAARLLLALLIAAAPGNLKAQAADHDELIPDEPAPYDESLQTPSVDEGAFVIKETIVDIVDSEVKEIAANFKFTEGPVWHPDGYLLFSDIPADTIYKHEPGADMAVFRRPSGNSNGLTLDAQNRLLAAEHGNRRLSTTADDGETKSLADNHLDKKFNSPNDLVVHSSGRIYFTDPDYGLVGRTKEQTCNGVYRLDPDGAVALLLTDYKKPNGIALSPDETTLYVADTEGGLVNAYDVAPDGSLLRERLFCEVRGPDGMKVDESGRLFVTSSKGVAVFAADGAWIGVIKFPQGPANCAFGGPDRKTLFVTARTGLYSVRVKTPGLAVGRAAPPAPAESANWPGWRGPNHNGSSPARNLPSTWTPTSSNVAWATDMPGPSAATPIIWGDRVFLTSTDQRDLYAYCLDRATGRVLWRAKSSKSNQSIGRNNFASISPVTDGQAVYFLFGTGDFTAFDFDGVPLWSIDIEKIDGPLSLKYGYSSSPLLYAGKLYVGVLRNLKPYRGKGENLASYLLCIDPKTGKTLWKHQRETDAIGENLDAYTSPVPIEFDGRSEIVLIGGDYVTGHNPADGAELWRQAYNPQKRDRWRLVPSIVFGEGMIFGIQPRGGTLFAFRAGQSGLLPYSDVAWRFEGPCPDVATPLFHRGNLYVLPGGRDKILTCLDPRTGEVKWQGDLGGREGFWGSPTAADGKLYCMTVKGEVVVVAIEPEFKVLSRIKMGKGGDTCSSIAVADGQVFIRTDDKLYCVTK